jgi:C-terminal processing protease CtpA/Prc
MGDERVTRLAVAAVALLTCVTGMRVPLPDGTALHGRGIVPDEVVHPTLEGIRAGRDEVLEAAIGVAHKLIAK